MRSHSPGWRVVPVWLICILALFRDVSAQEWGPLGEARVDLRDPRTETFTYIGKPLQCQRLDDTSDRVFTKKRFTSFVNLSTLQFQTPKTDQQLLIQTRRPNEVVVGISASSYLFSPFSPRQPPATPGMRASPRLSDADAIVDDVRSPPDIVNGAAMIYLPEENVLVDFDRECRGLVEQLFEDLPECRECADIPVDIALELPACRRCQRQIQDLNSKLEICRVATVPLPRRLLTSNGRSVVVSVPEICPPRLAGVVDGVCVDLDVVLTEVNQRPWLHDGADDNVYRLLAEFEYSELEKVAFVQITVIQTDAVSKSNKAILLCPRQHAYSTDYVSIRDSLTNRYATGDEVGGWMGGMLSLLGVDVGDQLRDLN